MRQPIYASASIEEHLIQNISDINIAKVEQSPLICLHLCHKQQHELKNFAKVVIEASVVICKIEQRDELICQQFDKLRRRMNCFEISKQLSSISCDMQNRATR